MTADSKKSKKTLGVFALTMINVIAIDNLRSLPASANFGFSLVTYYVIATLFFFIPVALISAELATVWPNKGGIYVWVKQAFGELWGFFVIWLQWIFNVVWYPTQLTFVATVAANLIDPSLANNQWYTICMITTIFWLSTFINCFGMRISSMVSIIGAIIGTIIPMTVIIFAGIYWLWQGFPINTDISWISLWPDFHKQNNLAFLIAMVFGLVGIEMSAVHADEVKNPEHSYPRAILYSTLIIFLTLVFASLAIAIIVPNNHLDLINGLSQAFNLVLPSSIRSWANPILNICIIIGATSAVATWVIGPTKGLLVAAEDDHAPKWILKKNKYDVPVYILLGQAILFTLLSVFYVFLPVKTAYFLLTILATQLSLILYVVFFAASLALRKKRNSLKHGYKIPGGTPMVWVLACLGITTCICVIILGFIIPEDLEITNLYTYILSLLIGIPVLCLPPFIIHYFNQRK